jgi:hypothetical protein
MPRFTRLAGRRLGPVGVAFTLWDIWRRLPPKQRRQLMDAARRHGPRLAQQAMDRRRAGRPRR